MNNNLVDYHLKIIKLIGQVDNCKCLEKSLQLMIWLLLTSPVTGCMLGYVVDITIEKL